MKKTLSILLALVMIFALSACGASKPAAPATQEAPAADVEMKYMTADEALKVLGTDGYTFFDVRKAADYEEAHIPGALGYDMDAAKEGDAAKGIEVMKAATKDLSDNLILVCYSGKRYAQATTNALSAIGYDMSKVFTLEGGFNNWKEVNPNQVEMKIAAPEKDVEMKYMTAADAVGLIGNADYTFMDVRKAADFEEAHITGAVNYDMDAAKEGNFEAGVATMQEALKEHNNNLILVCYSGKRYAQATTNVLSALGYDMSKVFTLEGGFNNWKEVNPNQVAMKIVAPEKDVEMNYITAADALGLIGNADYTFMDVRKAADYNEAHITGAVSYDMDAAKEGDFEAGVATMQEALKEHSNNLILVCYSGKRYAQATTNVLSALGYDMSKVCTLEGGFNNWKEVNPSAVEK